MALNFKARHCVHFSPRRAWNAIMCTFSSILHSSLPRAAAPTSPNNLTNPFSSSPPYTHIHLLIILLHPMWPPDWRRTSVSDTGRLVNPLPAPMGSHHGCKLSHIRRGQHRYKAPHTHPDLAVSFSSAGAWKGTVVWCFLSLFLSPFLYPYAWPLTPVML